MIKALLGFAALVVAVYPGAAFGTHTFNRRDISQLYMPIWSFAHDCLRNGVLPLWNPHVGCGAPLFANVIHPVFYPGTLVFWLAPFSHAFNLYVLVHLALAGFFTYLWMRECGASPAAAFFAGVAFCLGGYMLSLICLTAVLCPSAYVPLILFLFRRFSRRPGAKGAAALAAAMVLQDLSGDPLYVILALLFLFISGAIVSRRAVGMAAAAAALFLGLAAFQLFGFVELWTHSSRRAMGAQEQMLWSLPPLDLLNAFFPWARAPDPGTYWEGQDWLRTLYPGLTVTALAAIVALGARRRLTRWLAALGAADALMALGRHTPLYGLLRQMFPPLGLVRYPVRFYLFTAFAVACLAGFGLDFLGRKRSGRWTLLIIAAAMIELTLVNATERPIPMDAYLKPSPNLEAVMRDGGIFRVMASPKAVADPLVTRELLKERFLPNVPLRYGLDSVNHHDSVFLEAPMAVLNLFYRTDAGERDALLALLNVRYLVSPNEDLGEGLELVRSAPGVNLFRIRRELPRAFLAKRAVIVQDREKILTLMADPSFKPRDTIYLEEGADGPEAAAVPGDSRVTIVDYGPNHAQMDVIASDRRWLFFSDAYYPGWNAQIDGKRTRIHRADYAFN